VGVWNVLIKVVVGGVRTLDGWYGILYGELTAAALLLLLLLLLLLCNVQLSMGGLLGGFWIFMSSEVLCFGKKLKREGGEEKKEERKILKTSILNF
jgi:hypothetical protein